jgi:hypothetical protein
MADDQALSVVKSEPLPALSVVKSEPLAESSASAPAPAGGALPLAAAGAIIPRASGWAMELATNPDAWKTGKVLGEVAGGIAGFAKGGPIGAAGGMYVGGKAGWRLVNAAQRVANPVATLAEKLAPYSQTLATLGGAQGVNELAQMAEPNRRDIGFLGIGSGMPDPKNPAMLNAFASWLHDQYLRATGGR